ncbi:hypothetical protein ACFL1E_01215 [Candidatus Omnitrophota bacterium]
MDKKLTSKKVRYELQDNGDFIIENYDLAKPFSSFFPGVAGVYGIPLWVFYVNRGQCIASFGSKNKDGAIMEFFPANKAYQNTSLHGFRTFIKAKKRNTVHFYEPFQNNFFNTRYTVQRKMIIANSELRLEEVNHSLGIAVTVTYFSIPCEPFGGLARVVSIKNVSKRPLPIELIDGLPIIIPYGVNDRLLKEMSRTLEAWMNVEHLDKKNVAVYKLKVYVSDKPEVINVDKGNFYICFHKNAKRNVLIKPIVEPEYVFGPITDFTYPFEFFKNAQFTLPKRQITDNKTPAAFSYLKFHLKDKQEKQIYSVFGHAHHVQHLDQSIKSISKSNYFQDKQEENANLIDSIADKMFTVSKDNRFNLYCRQTFLDNTLRGGLPIVLNHESSHAFHVYWRKHGDLERDYNNFLVNPTYFSEGNGNYRDINQNRRNDVWFNPLVKDTNILLFFNLIQADGFNPLTFRGIRFVLKDRKKAKRLFKRTVSGRNVDKVLSMLTKPFVPGELFEHIADNNLKLKVSNNDFISRIISMCEVVIKAAHNEDAITADGYWTDHWTYNTDALERYLSLYPEKLREILLNKKAFAFYDNPIVVLPRDEKYVIKDNWVRQFPAIGLSLKKKKMLEARTKKIHWMRDNFGIGKVYKTNLLAKMLCLVCNKITALDPFGIGIEMEADRPNWYDALNGLPALFGSSLNEAFELKRLAVLLHRYIATLDLSDAYEIAVFEELFNFFKRIDLLLGEWQQNNKKERNRQYWDTSNTSKEAYRKKIELGVSGKEKPIPIQQIKLFLNKVIEKLDDGIRRAYAYSPDKAIPPTYFSCEVTKFKPLYKKDTQGRKVAKRNQFNLSCVKPIVFRQRSLPLFLEGPVHALKLEEDKIKAHRLYRAIRRSQLFDKKLGMYKVSASLEKEPKDIGRTKIFTPGWLENESIWLHMEYKFLLELLRKGLYEQFFKELKSVLVPFQKPEVYGRNILENSSFIASSSNPDPKLHGNGFVARLSGSTAEFLHIWLLMTAGETPFFMNERKELNLKLAPVLPQWLFTKKKQKHCYARNGKEEEIILERHCFAFLFLGKMLIVYHNPRRKNTYGKNGSRPYLILLTSNGKQIKVVSDCIPAPHAEKIRNCQVDRIDIYLQ